MANKKEKEIKEEEIKEEEIKEESTEEEIEEESTEEEAQEQSAEEEEDYTDTFKQTSGPTVEDYNRESTEKYLKDKEGFSPNKIDNKKLKSAKKKSKKPILFIIYILVVIIGLLIYVGNNSKESNEMTTLIEEKYEEIAIENPMKEKVSDKVLTNEAAGSKYPGEAIGYIEIPTVNMKAPIYQGKSNDNQDMEDVMHYSIGHEPESYLPGEGKQVVFTGHREENFKALKDVKKDDLVIVVIDDGTGEKTNTFLYKVSEIFTVKPSGEEAIQKVRGETDEEKLVLYTCYPFTPFTPVTDRYVVKADRVAEYKFENLA